MGTPKVPLERPRPPSAADAAALEAALRRVVRGEVRFGPGDRALYATDASNYRQAPVGVVIPEDAADVETALAECRRFGAAVFGRGGGTSLAGQCCNVGVAFDFSKRMNRILEINPETRTATVEPGVVLDALREAAEQYGLTFGPDPATHSRCTLGGMIGNNSCGTHSVMSGRTADNVLELDIVTYGGLRLTVGATPEPELERIVAEGGPRGEIYRALRDLRDANADEIRRRYPKIPRRVSGYNLDELLPENGFQVARALVGSESTCVLVLGAMLRLVPSPKHRAMVVVGYSDIGVAGDEVPSILEHEPIALESFDETLIRDMRRKGMHTDDFDLVPRGDSWLLVEFGAQEEGELSGAVSVFERDLDERGVAESHRTYFKPEDRKRILEVREGGVGSGFRVPLVGDLPAGWEDSAVSPERVGAYIRDLRSLAERHGYQYAFFGHIGQGCVHTRFNYSFKTAEDVKRYRSFISDAVDLVVRYGGSLSGEHGDGQARAEFLPRMYGAQVVEAFRAFKGVWDPTNHMNPGKIVDPYLADENLRWGPDYRPWEPETHFQFPHDAGRFALATERCVGIGKCRADHGGTMCPSYRVLREEKHVTRGRAHLLNEMLRGDPLVRRWDSPEVFDSLDYCLSCKGCKGDCPVNVDVATYKAEFLSHHYEGRLRPPHAYALGMAHAWIRAAAVAPNVANLILRESSATRLGKRLVGITSARPTPRIAEQTFRRWFVRRGGARAVGERVILWPDTFNNNLHPHVAQAAVRVLENAGFRVEIPRLDVCCGRPLYDYGFLGLAKRTLVRDLRILRDAITEGVPVVGLEPSCVSVFRDELPNLLHRNEDAHRLAGQTFTLAEFLRDRADSVDLPRWSGRVLLHGHCHQKAILDFKSEADIIRRMGADLVVPDSGCCGLAGSFGFEAEKYDVSMQIGEHEIFGPIRQEPDSTAIVTDGFSCREQVRHGTGRRALHFAELLERAVRA